ncbi:MAG: MFS transporter [Clostridia bacterium]|nr:MFS transporter [Clostridia bacterium]
MNAKKEFSRAKTACYLSNITMAVVAILSPLLFVTFREEYGISYTALGFLAVICFCSQLAIDLVFSFLPKLFDPIKAIKVTPLVTTIGFIVYGVMPMIFNKNVFLWVAIGTVIFSVASGLNEVLISPLVASIPSDNPEREMSNLHSVYAWGVVVVVVLSTALLKLVGRTNWFYLPLIWSVLALITFIVMVSAKMPSIKLGNEGGKKDSVKITRILPFALVIFFGGASEIAMTQWCSGYLEKVMGLSKTWGDIFGLALFALFLGLGRTLYAKRGKNIERVLILGFAVASVCYMVAGLVSIPIIALGACVLTGFCVSMLWPGTLIYCSNKYPSGGVIMYALLAAGGDLGGSIAPQAVGAVSDLFAASPLALKLAQTLNLTTEQVGMKAGILSAVIFPILGALTVFLIERKKLK